MELTSEQKEIIAFYKNALIRSNNDEDFSGFIENLSEEELISYLYFEAQRSKCFLEELGLATDGEINRLFKDNRHLIKSNSKYDFMINFISDITKFGKSSEEVIRNVIKKYNEHIRVLSEDEIKFFMEC
ncbi:hypothetical protein D9V86_05475 [Bacteroidetes/Chlorobi group bacterium ChocPot_Mid]|nr:MAG: hypothetical protein D9V86_05475 [Bacteroidetes/Chlorobi group bacterium ChocPot_Mid]